MKQISIHKRRADTAERYLERIARADNMRQVQYLVSLWQSESLRWHPLVIADRATRKIARMLGRAR
jgi:hypothetical protein